MSNEFELYDRVRLVMDRFAVAGALEGWIGYVIEKCDDGALVQFQRTFAIPEMWTGIIVLGLLGVCLSLAFQFVERRVLRWYHGLWEAHRHE